MSISRLKLLLVPVFAATSMQAAVILVDYNFNVPPTNAPVSPATVALGSSATSFTPVSITTSTNGCPTDNIFCGDVARFGPTTSTTLDPDSYFEFGLSGPLGLDLESLEFNRGVYGTGGGALGRVTLRSSLDAFTSDLLTVNATPGGQLATFNFAPNTIANNVTFRLYGYDAANPIAARVFVDNVVVRGDVISAEPVPEPSTFGLLGMALLGGAVFLRPRSLS